MDATILLPISIEDEKGVVQLVIEDLGPDDARAAGLGELHRDRQAIALALQRSADDVVHVQHAAGLFRADAALAQGKDGALRDDEQAAQLGEPRDHVVGKAARRPTLHGLGNAALGERHDGNGGAATGWAGSVGGFEWRVACGGRNRLRPHSACTLCAACLPNVPKRLGVQSFRLEDPCRGRQVLFAFAKLAAPGEGVQEQFVDALVEWRELQPLLQIPQHIIAGCLPRQALQHGSVTAAKAAALSRQPAVEARVAVDLQAVQKLAREQRGQRAQALRRQRLDARLGRVRHLDRVDEAAGQVQPHGIPAGLDPAPAGLIDDAPQLAQAPAQLAARIVGDVPQQLAELASRYGLRCERQVGDERTQLARGGQRHVDAVAAQGQGPEQAHGKRTARIKSGPIGFHALSHAAYHACSHVRSLGLQ